MLLIQETKPKRAIWPMIFAVGLECSVVFAALMISVVNPATMKVEAATPTQIVYRPNPEPVKVVKTVATSGPSNPFATNNPSGPRVPPRPFQIPTGKGDLNTPPPGNEIIFGDVPDISGPISPNMPPGIVTTTGITNTIAPPPPAEKTIQRVRVGGKVQPPVLIGKVNPPYPSLAKASRIQGTVRLEAVISASGTIMNLRLVSGHPLLIDAAMNAVRQWRYQPPRLNDEPVEVATTIDVNFTLSQ